MNRPALIVALAGAGLLWLYVKSAPSSSSPLADIAEEIIDALSGAGAARNSAAFLQMIRAAEGTAGANGYYTLFGGQYFLELDTHPAVRTYGEWLEPGRMNYTTAAGAYQITLTTWRALAARLGLTDFSPATQDTMALELVRERGALAAVQAGRFDEALALVNPVWASLPGAPYPQKSRTVAFVRDAYERAGGGYAAA